MKTLPTCAAFAASLSIAAGLAAVANAQIINAPMPTAKEGVQHAAGNMTPAEEKSGFLPVSWPSVPMPRISMPRIWMPKWPTNADGTPVSPFAPITSGARKISEGTQKAWSGTKEMFGYGDSSDSAPPTLSAPTQPKPSFWQRMTGKKPEPDGPQTVAEWMSQPRVGN